MKVERRKGRDTGILSWKGTHPNGTGYRGKMWITLLNGFGVGLVAVSPSGHFPEREAALREIFATLGFKKPKSDPRLFGKWKYEKVYMSGSFSAITIRNMILNPNGTCLEGGKLSASMSHQDSDGNFTGSTGGNRDGGFQYRGRWSTRGKTLHMDWGPDGLEEWEYIISRGSMLLKSGKTKKLWTQIR